MKALFIAEVICVTVALVFAPTFWWLGILAGIAGGYIGAEFREGLAAMPLAWRQAQGKGVRAWEQALRWLGNWLAQPHPLFYPVVVVTLPLGFWLTSSLLAGMELFRNPLIDFLYTVTLAAMISFVVGVLTAVVLFFLAVIGAGEEWCYWGPYAFEAEYFWKSRTEEKQKKGYTERPLTYGRTLWWILRGLGVVTLFLLWTWWIRLLGELVKFVVNLGRLIHSEKRVLCAVYGTLGGVVSYLWLAPSATSWAGQVTLVLFGGLLGMAFGVAAREIVAKRIFQVPVNGVF
jgi:small-conductance mechanosensitive channel